MSTSSAKPAPGRRESPEERADRNFNDLLQELRVAHTGVQILFAFLLTLPFTQRFQQLNSRQETLYATTLITAALALALLVAPVATHRMTFRAEAKERVLQTSHVMTGMGLVCTGAAIAQGVLLALWTAVGIGWGIANTAVILLALLTFWGLVPLSVRRRSS